MHEDSLVAASLYFMRRIIRREKSILLVVVGIWILCVTIQRFAVPYVFKHVLHPYQVERIMNTFGVDYVPEDKEKAVELNVQKGVWRKCFILIETKQIAHANDILESGAGLHDRGLKTRQYQLDLTKSKITKCYSWFLLWLQY